MPKDKNKPRGKMTSYAFFVQTCREEHKKKHPNDSVVFAEFSKKCSEKWKTMGPKEKKRFEDMADRDKVRYENEMSHYTPIGGVPGGRKRKKTKDPNAPKRALSAFFFFCSEMRPAVRATMPGAGVGDIAKELGKRWEKVTDKTKYEKQAAGDKLRYEKEMAIYKGKKPKTVAPVVKKPEPEEEEDDDEDEDDDDDEDDEDDDE